MLSEEGCLLISVDLQSFENSSTVLYIAASKMRTPANDRAAPRTQVMENPSTF